MVTKRLNLLAGFSILSCGFMFGQDLTTGLVAYYPFNGNANDESGNGNATEVVGATLTIDKDDNPNQAYSFDGVDDYIKCSIGAYQEVSVSLWYRSDETHVAGDRPQTRQPYPTIFRYGGSQPGTRYVSVELSETDWGNSFNATVDYAFGRQHRIDLAGPLEQGIWRHAVVVKSASELTLYLDGKLIDSVSSNALLTGSDLYLGSSSIQTNTQNTDFLGAIDELRVYNRALTAAEIAKLSGQQTGQEFALDFSKPTLDSTVWKTYSPNTMGAISSHQYVEGSRLELRNGEWLYLADPPNSVTSVEGSFTLRDSWDILNVVLQTSADPSVPTDYPNLPADGVLIQMGGQDNNARGVQINTLPLPSLKTLSQSAQDLIQVGVPYDFRIVDDGQKISVEINGVEVTSAEYRNEEAFIDGGSNVVLTNREAWPHGHTAFIHNYKVNQIKDTTPLVPLVQLAALYESPSGEAITIDATPTAGFPAEFTYQWRFNGFTIPENFGGTASSINISSILANEGTWSVTVTNETGSIDESFEYRVYIDSDLDGLSDGFEELISQTDINNPDSDSDGLIDNEEVNDYYTNPNSPDSDSDGFTDLYEVQTAYDPNSDESFPDAQVDIMTAIEVSFSAALGKIYEIQFSVDTVDWAVVETDIVGEGNAIERLYSKKDFPRGFFRVEQKDQ